MKAWRGVLLSVLALLIVAPSSAEARVRVVTSTQDLAWLAQAIGGTEAAVEYLAPSMQDPHAVEPRPSMVAKLSRADMLVRVGMDLDLWVESLIAAAANSKIGLNGRGYVDCSRGVQALQIPVRKIDPSQGDIHVFGNPHYFTGPTNIPIVARNVVDGFMRVDPSNSDYYEANYEALIARLRAAMGEWRAKLGPHRRKGVITFHQSLIYFLRDFGLVEAGTIEPRPGLEPTPGHLRNLARDMKRDGVHVVVVENYRPMRWTRLLMREADAQLVVVPGGIGAERGVDDYFKLIGAIVDGGAAAL